MSAFMVADETINRVVTWLEMAVSKSLWLNAKLEKETGIDTAIPNWKQELGNAMFQLNIDGVNDRYGEGEAKHFRELNYRHTPAYGTKIQVLKSLQCWLYQCNEGDVANKPLYQFFDTVIEHYLLGSIITELPEYDLAEWG